MLYLIYRILLILFLVYIGSIIVIGLRESSYLFYPDTDERLWSDPVGKNVQYQDVFLDLQHGERIHGWWFPGRRNAPVILFLHGNAGNLSMRYSFVRYLQELPSRPGVFIIDYPGYGKSTGRPCEKNLYESGLAAIRYLTEKKQIDSDRIIIFGRSLGCAVALNTALSAAHAGLILECPFLSVPRMAEHYFPFLPGLKFFSRQHFDNEKKIRNLHTPLLLMLGDQDQVIPPDQGRRLFALAPEPKTFLEIQGAHHDDLYLVGGEKYKNAWAAFLKAVGNPGTKQD